MEWQPIETAPKDGTTIFIWSTGWPCAPLVYWDEYPGNPVMNFEGNDTWMWGWIWVDEFLFAPGEEDGFLGWVEDPEPTHWMPLPAPPEAD